jgi:hypothetical protein
MRRTRRLSVRTVHPGGDLAEIEGALVDALPPYADPGGRKPGRG